MSHTPGPWEVCHRIIAHDGDGGKAVGWGDRPDFTPVPRAAGGVSVGRKHDLLVGGPEYPCVALVEGATERAWADARLIAAAPDLLASLRECLDYLYSLDSPHADALASRAVRAIAKAHWRDSAQPAEGSDAGALIERLMKALEWAMSFVCPGSDCVVQNISAARVKRFDQMISRAERVESDVKAYLAQRGSTPVAHPAPAPEGGARVVDA